MNAVATTVAKVSPKRAFALILNAEEYLAVETRIIAMEVLWRDMSKVVLSIRGYVRYPLLETVCVLTATLSPYERIEIELEPGSLSLPGSLCVERLRAEFRFEPLPGGVKITYAEDCVMKQTRLGRLMERLGTNWLRRHVEEVTMPRLKQRLERHGRQET